MSLLGIPLWKFSFAFVKLEDTVTNATKQTILNVWGPHDHVCKFITKSIGDTVVNDMCSCCGMRRKLLYIRRCSRKQSATNGEWRMVAHAAQFANLTTCYTTPRVTSPGSRANLRRQSHSWCCLPMHPESKLAIYNKNHYLYMWTVFSVAHRCEGTFCAVSLCACAWPLTAAL